MRFDYLPPRHQLAEIMRRLYDQGLTTTSGGNLSIHDPDGSLWITPAGVDKGGLTPEDIVRVLPDGGYEGRHAPSSELPFHRRIYQARPDLRAIVHAHPVALVAFSLVGQSPETRLTPQVFALCGEVGYAPYALTGSELLGERIAGAFASGANVIMLENHGAVAGGSCLIEAFHRLETLEFSAQTQINAVALGAYDRLTPAQLALYHHEGHHTLPQAPLPGAPRHAELEARLAITQIVQRAYAHRLMTSTTGTVSARLGADDFLITPADKDRLSLRPEDIVRVREGARDAGGAPCRSARLHRAIYAAQPEVRWIISAQPPGIIAFCIARDVAFDTHLIPETYLVLRDLPTVPWDEVYRDPSAVAERLSAQSPAVLVRHEGIVATGRTPLQAFDRVEVAEFSAQALLRSRSLGALRLISAGEIDHLRRKFFPDEAG